MLTNGLRVNPSGGVIERSGCGDEQVVAHNAVAIPTGSNTYIDPVDIEDVKQIGLLIILSNLGQHSVVTFEVSFDDGSGTWFNLINRTISSGIMSSGIKNHFNITTTGNKLIPIKNPGAKRIRVGFIGNGLGSGGLVSVNVLRGWGRCSPIIK